MSDFEAALWSAVKETLPTVERHTGCSFHLKQAFLRKVNKLIISIFKLFNLIFIFYL